MNILYWTSVSAMFIISFIGLIYPIIPSVVFILGGFILYGFFFSFEPFTWLFWTVQILFVVLLFSADYLANMLGVKKFGGSKAAIWGSTVGLLVGPFVIPILGILIGPFLGAVLAELVVNRKSFSDALRIGIGSVIGFISSVITKSILQAIMIMYFLYIVL
jgi:uncharacterized protein